MPNDPLRQTHSLLHLADKVRLEAARRVVPLEALAVPVPQLHAVLLLAVLVAEVVRLARVPVGERDRASRGHPEEVALVREVGARRPEVLVAEACKPQKGQKSSLERSSKRTNEFNYRNRGRASPGGRSPPATICWPGACRGTYSTGRPGTSWPEWSRETSGGYCGCLINCSIVVEGGWVGGWMAGFVLSGPIKTAFNHVYGFLMRRLFFSPPRPEDNFGGKC